MKYLPIIGLEIHARLKTKSKMFCGCRNVDDSAPPNTAICPVCTGQPGALPATNAEAVRLGVRAGLALGCRMAETSHFDRKNYFYPDLPKGYQISQFDFPIALEGRVELEIPHAEPRPVIKIGITRAHLEEDAAKNIHDAKTDATLVDFNRSGTPLLEIVTEPDFRSPIEAKAFLQELQEILRAVGASEADMEKGYMRCDANISLLPVDDKNRPLQKDYNPKVEVKNLNSFKAVERALAFEIERQGEIYERGGKPEPATRGWNENTGQTFDQRSKETSADYRYFPEPDLPPLELKVLAKEEAKHLPELPGFKRRRLMDEYGFSAEDARFLTANEGWADFAEDVMSELETYKLKTKGADLGRLAGGWLTSKFAGLLAQKNLRLKECDVDAENFAEFLALVAQGAVNSSNAQKLLSLMMEKGGDPSHILEENNLGQNEDPKELAKTVALVIEENPDQVAQLRAGKINVVKWLVGVVMKSTEGRANPQKAEEEIKKQLGL